MRLRQAFGGDVDDVLRLQWGSSVAVDVGYRVEFCGVWWPCPGLLGGPFGLESNPSPCAACRQHGLNVASRPSRPRQRRSAAPCGSTPLSSPSAASGSRPRFAGLLLLDQKSCSVETHSGASRRIFGSRPPRYLPAAPVLIQDSGFGNQGIKESRNQHGLHSACMVLARCCTVLAWCSS